MITLGAGKLVAWLWRQRLGEARGRHGAAALYHFGAHTSVDACVDLWRVTIARVPRFAASRASVGEEARRDVPNPHDFPYTVIGGASVGSAKGAGYVVDAHPMADDLFEGSK